MSHSINKEQYHERYHPPVPQQEHLDSAEEASEANKAKSQKGSAEKPESDDAA